MNNRNTENTKEQYTNNSDAKNNKCTTVTQRTIHEQQGYREHQRTIHEQQGYREHQRTTHEQQ